MILPQQEWASLNHPNIIRYFDAWDETPPPGWQECQDNAVPLSSSINECYDLDSELMDISSFDSRQLDDRFADLYVHSDSSSFQCRKVGNDSGDPEEIIIKSELNLLVSSNSISPGNCTYHYILMELCREESLAKWLETRDPQLDIYKMYREILKAVKYLHEQVNCVIKFLSHFSKFP